MTEAFETQLIAENFLLRAEVEDLKKRLSKSIPVKPLTMMDTVPVFARMDVPRRSMK